ncbi:MAG: TraM recognition domain-containing protein [Candidatus Saccharimonadales bacterium]
MIPFLIHLPPPSNDIDGGGRDERDVTEEVLSQAQVMYNIIASTATRGFKSHIFGQRHIAFEIVATKGTISYYLAIPHVMTELVQQAVAAAYPSARLEEVEEHNIFSKTGKVSGTIGGELVLKKQYAYPIATFQDSKRDAMRALLNSMTVASREDGIGLQILIRPAPEGWAKNALSVASNIRKNKGVKTGLAGAAVAPKDLLEALWKAPESSEAKPEDKQLTNLEQATIESIEEKTRYPAYEVLIRVVASSNTSARSQGLLKNLVASFSLFDAPGKNGFKFNAARDIEQFISAYIFRFFPQDVRMNVLNSVELATIFHLPDQNNIPTSQVQRQSTKQVDGPNVVLEEGFLLGYNVYRGIKKEIRLGAKDRRRHLYMIGQTGTGKSGFLVNIALQDMLDGKGFAFIDPHGDSVEQLMGMVPKERVEDVIYFNPSDMDNPVGLNLFEFETPDQRDFLVQEAIAMLYRLYDPGHTGIIGPRYEHWFRNAALTIMSDPNGSSFIDIPQVFNDNEFAKEKLKYVTDQTVLDFWNKEMAQTSDYHKSEVLGWFVSKFGAFLSNEMMRNIIGQTRSGFNLRDIMDNKKILLVNLSKGKTGELNSQLLGMIFVMKFQAAAMGRADIAEDQRIDFSLYVDEFQNFATDSFESILSEARKYRLSLILANQFMTQLTDKIREAIIGNVGTIISGRIGTTDAELMVKRFQPTFDVEDLTRLPNYETITSVMINDAPSAPFSMSLIPPLGNPNPQLADALKRLSAAKFGRARGEVEREIFARLRAGDDARDQRRKEFIGGDSDKVKSTGPAANTGSSFLDEWLAKRRESSNTAKPVNSVQASSVDQTLSQKSHNTDILQTTDMSASNSSMDNIVAEGEPRDSTEPTHTNSVRYDRTNELESPFMNTSAEQADAIRKSFLPHPMVKAQTDERLNTLQSQGIGSQITFGDDRPTTNSTAPSEKDKRQINDALDPAKNKQLAQVAEQIASNSVDTSTLKVREPLVNEDGLEEIYIDVRGNLHHTKTDTSS